MTSLSLEFREPAIPVHRIGVPGKQAAKVATSSNVYLERNKENAQHQVDNFYYLIFKLQFLVYL